MTEVDAKYQTDHGEEWQTFLKTDKELRNNIKKLRQTYEYVLEGNKLMPSQTHRESITNAGLKAWSEEVHADILETILQEFSRHKNYQHCLNQVALHIGVFPEEQETDLSKGMYYPERQMMRRLLKENGLTPPCHAPSWM